MCTYFTATATTAIAATARFYTNYFRVVYYGDFSEDLCHVRFSLSLSLSLPLSLSLTHTHTSLFCRHLSLRERETRGERHHRSRSVHQPTTRNGFTFCKVEEPSARCVCVECLFLGHGQARGITQKPDESEGCSPGVQPKNKRLNGNTVD